MARFILVDDVYISVENIISISTFKYEYDADYCVSAPTNGQSLTPHLAKFSTKSESVKCMKWVIDRIINSEDKIIDMRDYRSTVIKTDKPKGTHFNEYGRLNLRRDGSNYLENEDDDKGPFKV